MTGNGFIRVGKYAGAFVLMSGALGIIWSFVAGRVLKPMIGEVVGEERIARERGDSALAVTLNSTVATMSRDRIALLTILTARTARERNARVRLFERQTPVPLGPPGVDPRWRLENGRKP